MTATKLKVRLYGDPCLRKESQPITQVGPAERMLIEQMILTMHEDKGIGLAAPQIGINQQLFVVDIGDGPFAVINPKVIAKSGSEVMEEGCLCLPEIGIKVKRPTAISVSYTDQNNQTVERELTQLLARVFLHENDHLHGKLIIDYADLITRFKLREKLADLKKQSAQPS